MVSFVKFVVHLDQFVVVMHYHYVNHHEKADLVVAFDDYYIVVSFDGFDLLVS